MIKKTITYTDFAENTRTEDHYFNLTKAEVYELQVSMPGGLSEHLHRMTQEQDITKLSHMFIMIIEKSYGIRSEDGRYFEKTQLGWDRFKSTNAYSELLMELLSDENTASEFINKLLPSDLNAQQAAPVAQPQDYQQKQPQSNVTQMPTPPQQSHPAYGNQPPQGYIQDPQPETNVVPPQGYQGPYVPPTQQ